MALQLPRCPFVRQHAYSLLNAGLRLKRSRACAGKGFGKAPVEPPAPQPRGEKKGPRGKTGKAPSKVVAEKQKRVTLEERLGSVSVIFVGDDSQLNDATAAAFARAAGYNLLLTSAVIQQYTGQTCAEVELTEGRHYVAAAEIEIIEKLSPVIRCSIGTLGGGYGAAARGDAWRYMYGAFVVWLDTKPDEDAASAPQREAYAQAELHVKIDPEVRAAADVVASSSESVGAADGADSALVSSEDAPAAVSGLEGLANDVVAQVAPGLLDLVNRKPDLPQGKIMYIKLGCRGDWPDLMPPSWVPDAESAA